VTIISLSACVPSGQHLASPVSVPEHFSATGSTSLPERWWLSFSDPDLNLLVDKALSGNLTLQGAWERLHQAEALQRKAGAGLFPTLNAEAESSVSKYRTGGKSGSDSLSSLGLAAGYEIDLWGRIRSSRDAAAFDARSRVEDLQTAALTLSAQVAGTWYQLVEQYGQLELLDSQIRTNSQVLDLVTLQFRTGQTGIADVLQQRQLVESNLGERAQVQGQARVLEHQLSVLMGVAPGAFDWPRKTDLAGIAPLPDTGIPAALVERRPDVRSAWYQVLAADRQTASAVSERFPRISLSAGILTSGDSGALFDDWLASLAANLVAPLIDGGQRRAEVERTRALTRERLTLYGQTVLEALAEVEDALAGEEHQQAYLDSLDRQLELARNVIGRVRDRYLNGAEDYQRVLNALLSYQQLQRSRLSGQRTLLQYRIDLCRALGTGWSMPTAEPSPVPPLSPDRS